jgi:hypothetical protein
VVVVVVEQHQSLEVMVVMVHQDAVAAVEVEEQHPQVLEVQEEEVVTD